MDWRLTQIEKMANVSTFPGSPIIAEDALEAGYNHIILATGATWRRDGIGRSHWQPIPGHDHGNVFSPDDIMVNRLPTGRVVIFDDDHYYIGGVIAERLTQAGCEVTLVTASAKISAWTEYTLEQERIQTRLIKLGVRLHTQRTLKRMLTGGVTLSCGLTDTVSEIVCDAVVLVTDRLPHDSLYRKLKPIFAK